MTNRASNKQLSALETFVAEDKKIENNKISAVFTKQDLQKKWETIADKLNEMSGAKKNWSQWRKTYFDMRSRSKVNRAKDRKILTGTEGGTFKKHIYSQAKETALNNMADVAIEGHKGVRESVVIEEEEVGNHCHSQKEGVQESKINRKISNTVAECAIFAKLQAQQNEENKNFHAQIIKLKEEKNANLLRIALALEKSILHSVKVF